MIKLSDLNLLQRIWLEVLWASVWLFSVLPYWVKFYLFEPLFYFLLYRVLHYRRKVILENLRNSFPEKRDEELEPIIRGFYHNLAEVFIGTFNMAHMPDKKIRRYYKMTNLDEVYSHAEGRDIIVAFAHQGLWELGCFFAMENPKYEAIGVYHQLRSKVLDLFYQRLRSTPYSTPVQKKESMMFYLRHRDEGVRGRRIAFGLIADQNPPLRPDAHWYTFLSQPTVFFDGPEQLALRYHLPIFFGDMQRVGKGRYEMRFELLYDGDEKLDKHVITERYVRRLERMILERPDLWMWSHRRWKHKPQDAEE